MNRSIRKHKFGRSSYEFVCTCNEDYREYYNLITNKELNGHNLLNTTVYEENEELIHELFDKISSLSSMQDPKKFQAIIVTPTDKISNLSKVADATLIATTDEKNGQRVSTVQKWSQKETRTLPDMEGIQGEA